MPTLDFGQPETGIIQMAYVVADIARYEEQGYEVAFRAGVPTGGSVAYMDTKGALPGFVEIIELGDGMEAAFTAFYAASLSWDGSDPVRSFA